MNHTSQARAEPREHSCELDISVPSGGTIRVTKTVPTPSTCRETVGAVMLIPGPIATRRFFRIPVDGYDASARLAHAGYTCFAVDLAGTGDSSRLGDGRHATVRRQVDDLHAVIHHLNSDGPADRIDLVGESWGGAIASQLAADAERVRSCTMVSTLFRTSTPLADAMFRDPRWRAVLDALPDGYLPVDEQIWGSLVARSPSAVAEWTLAHERGAYPSAPMYAVLDLPYFDPGVARVPGLVLHGDQDDRQSAQDAADLAAAYGPHGATLVTLPGAGHIPRIEHAAVRESFWSQLLEFLEADSIAFSG